MPESKRYVAVRANDDLTRLAESDPLLKSFERHIKADGLAEHTRTHYLGAVRDFLFFCYEQGMPYLTQVKREHVESWLAFLYNHYARATVLNRFKGLLQFYKWLTEEGEIKTNPMTRIKRPTLDETRKDVIDPSVLSFVFKELERRKRWRDCAILAIFYDTGMRAGELARCRIEHVNLDTGQIVIPKTKNHNMRVVGLSPKTIRYIDRYLRKPRKSPEFLINGRKGPVTANGLYQIVRAIFEELTDLTVKVGPHDLRHTSASHVVGELSESEMMTLYGWSDPEMVRHYTRQMLEKQALKAHAKVDLMGRLTD